MITCLECGKSYKLLTNTHLKSHAMSLEEYLKKHPDALTISSETSAKQSQKTIARNNARDYSLLGKKISATKQAKIAAGVDYGASSRGKPMSSEQKALLSKAAIERYANGRIHHNLGKSPSDETRAKISSSLINTAAPNVLARKKVREQAYQEKIAKREAELSLKLEVQGVHLDSIDKTHASLTCLSCSSSWSLTHQYLDASRISKIFCRVCVPKKTTSVQEAELFEFIKSLGFRVTQGDRSILGGKEIDVLVNDLKVGFEFNGLYWHSELVRGMPKHLLWKQQHAWKQGYKLYHIFEDEWRDKQDVVKSRIRSILGVSTTRLNARQLDLIKLSSSEKQSFLQQHHLQGGDVSSIRYGLKRGDELVACMTFKKTSYVKGGTGDEYELNRFATKMGVQVRGGASRLLTAFIREHAPSTVISYADRRWSFGNLYSSLGFKFESHSAPSYWYMENYTRREHRSVYMKHRLVSEGSDASQTEWEIMQARGYDRIWDCGTLKYRLFLPK